MGEAGGVTLEWGNTANTVSHVVKVDINTDKSFWQHVSFIRCDEVALSLCGHLLKICNSRLIMRVILDKSQLKNILKTS